MKTLSIINNIAKAKKNFREACINFLLPLCLFILFQKSINIFLSKWIIAPIFSNCFPENLLYDISVFVIFLSIIIPTLNKIFSKKAQVSNKWCYRWLAYTFIYFIFYRCFNSTFDYTSFKLIKSIRLLDFINTIPLIIVTSNYITLYFEDKRKKKPNNKIKNTEGFSVDNARIIPEKDDLLNRGKFIKVFIQKIKETESLDSSFPIGIVARWGSGKSTFVNTLVEEFLKEDLIVIELNVWKCGNSAQIIDTLFKLFKSKLGEFSFSIDNKIQDYVTNLLKGTKIEALNTLKNITELFLPDSSIEDLYDQLNSEIKRINKKIVVVIDDIDRLDKREIYEVIRLIRNTASFANTFFIVAYDRNYILNAIEDINPYQSHYFLEKIFQLEFTLPPIPINVIQSEIEKGLRNILTKTDLKAYVHLQNRGFDFFEYGIPDLYRKFIHNIRDVIRFLNSFKLNYEFVKSEIYLPDFYNLELIRFKHPELFMDIYRNREQILTTTTPTSNGNFSLTEFTYFLREVKNNPNAKTELKQFLEEVKTTYKINEDDIDNICTAYQSIFPQQRNMYSSRQKAPNAHLSVIHPSMFERYFHLNIEGRLSEVDFSNARNGTLNDFLEQINSWVKDEDLIVDIADRFGAISEFNDKDDFEKVVTAIFYFADIIRPNKNYLSYNTKKLATLIGNKNRIALYNGNANEYKNFLFTIFKKVNSVYTSTDDFLNELLETDLFYRVNDIFNANEISKILLEKFIHLKNESQKISDILWKYFWNCIVRKDSTEPNSNRIQVSRTMNKKAIREMRKFICTKDIDGFLIRTISNHRRGAEEYSIDDEIIAPLFINRELLIDRLSKSSATSKYKEEYIKLYHSLNKNPEYKVNGVPYDFFKVIPIKKYQVEVTSSL